MSLKNLETKEFQELMQEHIIKTIEYMFNNNQEFGVACEVSNVIFEPTLPKELQESLPEITLFMVANYSFESASLDENYLSFEAGFGKENIGALVQIPILAIKQLFVEEYPVLMNISTPFRKEESEINEAEEHTEVNSMNALLNNPENAKLLQKKK